MARILVNMPSQYGGKPSGVARVAFSLLERLIELGEHDYILRSAWKKSDLPEKLRCGVKHLPIKRPRIMVGDVFRQAIIMPLICRRAGADIVWNVDVFGAALGGRARVTTVHDLFYRHAFTLGRKSRATMALCYQLVLSGSTRVVAISEVTTRELADAFPKISNRLAVIANDATISPSSLTISAREIVENYILVVGNTTPNKNYGAVVAALTRLQVQYGEAPTLVHVGVDEGAMLATAIRHADPAPRLITLSGVDDLRLGGLYAHAECLVVPSLSEGFCLPIVEAQAFSCPVLASNRSVMPEVGGDGALYFDPADSAQLAEQIRALIGPSATRTLLVERGHKNRGRYSWEASARAYHDLFTDLAT